jgi:serine/threonine protein kinase
LLRRLVFWGFILASVVLLAGILPLLPANGPLSVLTFAIQQQLAVLAGEPGSLIPVLLLVAGILITGAVTIRWLQKPRPIPKTPFGRWDTPTEILPPGDGDPQPISHTPPRTDPLIVLPPDPPAPRTDEPTQAPVPVESVLTPPPANRDHTTTFTGLNQGMWIAHYHLQKRLDKGERSRVYQAHDERLDRPVALKALNAQVSGGERSERFKREAQLLGKLHHAHIVPLYDYGVLNDINYTVMPLLTGGSLEDKLGDTFSPAQTLAVARPLGEALDYIHANGVIHRDLKAGNILFGEQNKLYLVDFGIAKILDAGQQALTAVGQVIGTPQTMPPEQWVGEKVTAAADQYTFAALVYRMLTGAMPFTADSPYRYMLQHLRETPPPPSSRRAELPGAVDAVLLKALAKDPAERYPAISNFVDALERSLRGADTARKEGHIFLSYSRADGDYARSVAGYLRGHGFAVWMDDKIEPSEEWWPNIVEALDQCCAFIVIMSPSSAESRWVARETLLADEKRKPAFPLLLRGKAFPIYVATQYADVSDGSMPNEVFLRRLAGAMGREVASG